MEIVGFAIALPTLRFTAIKLRIYSFIINKIHCKFG
jgi:hypothetical protein